MAREYRDERVTRTERKCVRLTCDLCEREGSPTNEWESGSYQVNETEVSVTVRHKTGTAYSEGGHGKEYSVDLCPACFKDRLLPWLRSQGATVREADWDY